MKVVAFNASPRPDGNTAAMLKAVLAELAQQGIETQLIHIGGAPLQGCTGCRKCYEMQNNRCIINDRLNDYLPALMEADGILLGSPVYYSDITTNMKSFIDRAGSVCRANNAALRRKVGAAVCAVRRAGAIHSLDTMHHLFLISEMLVVGSSYWNMSLSRDKGDFAQDAEGVKTMQVLGQNMAWILQKIHKD
jgi:multimeric flavodoxin WrbA